MLPVIAVFFLTILGAEVESRKCTTWAADNRVLQQCGFGVAKFIACQVKGVNITVGESAAIGDLQYCCNLTGEVQHRMHVIDSSLCGCVFNGEPLGFNDTSISGTYRLKCENGDKGVRMAIDACKFGDKIIEIGASEVISGNLVGCIKEGKSVRVGAAGCVYKDVSIPFGETVEVDSFKLGCEPKGRSSQLTVESCKQPGGKVVKPGESVIDEDFQYVCGLVKGVPTSTIKRCLMNGDDYRSGSYAKTPDYFRKCDISSDGQTATFELGGCFFKGNVVALDKAFQSGVTKYHCVASDDGKTAKLVTMGCVMNDHVLPGGQSFKHGHYRYTCEKDEDGELQMKKTGCFLKLQDIAAGESAYIGMTEYTCEQKSNGDLKLVEGESSFKL